MGGGEPAAAVIDGRAELAAAPLTTVLSYPGLELAGLFPEALIPAIRMSMFLAPGAPPPPGCTGFSPTPPSTRGWRRGAWSASISTRRPRLRPRHEIAA